MKVAGHKLHIYPSEEFCLRDLWHRITASEERIQELEVSSLYISRGLAKFILKVLETQPIREVVFRMCEAWPQVWEDIITASADIQHLSLHRVTKLRDSFWQSLVYDLPRLRSLKIHHREQSSCQLSTLLQDLHNFRYLESLHLDGSQLYHPNCITALCESLTRCSHRNSLKTLSFKSCMLTSDSVARIVTTISTHIPQIEHLDLSINCCYESAMQALANMLLSETCNLKTLELVCQLPRGGPLPIHILVPSLKANTTLKCLRLSGNRISGVSFLQEVLACNRSITTLDWFGNCLEEYDLVQLGQTLSQNETLRELNIRANRFGRVNDLDLSKNDSLCRLDHSCRGPAARRIAHMCKLNAAGRRFLRCEPPHFGIWTLVLEQSAMDADTLFYFVKNTPHLWNVEKS